MSDAVLLGARPARDDDGSHRIKIRLADSSEVQVALTPEQAGLLIGALQRTALDHLETFAESRPHPVLSVARVDLAQGATSELMVTTVEVGSLVLQMETVELLKAKSEIERLLALRSIPKGRN